MSPGLPDCADPPELPTLGLVAAALRFAGCGTGYLVCNGAGAIRWSYLEGGDGVVFRHG